jgi:hypothetical protein
MLKDFIESNKDNVLFLRNSFRRYIYIALILLVINIGLVTFLYLNLLTVPTAQNFATTSDGRIIDIFPED